MVQLKVLSFTFHGISPIIEDLVHFSRVCVVLPLFLVCVLILSA